MNAENRTAEQIQHIWLESENIDECWQIAQALGEHLKCNPHAVYTALTNLTVLTG